MDKTCISSFQPVALHLCIKTGIHMLAGNQDGDSRSTIGWPIPKPRWNTKHRRIYEGKYVSAKLERYHVWKNSEQFSVIMEDTG